MIFLRRQFPVLIAFAIGIFTFSLYFIPTSTAKNIDQTLNIWISIIGAFALVLGIDSVLSHHIEKIRKKRPGFGYSWLLILGFIAMNVSWIFWGGLSNPLGPFSWMFYNMFVPLSATMFSILAFFIASAAYRSFRAKTPEAAVLLIAAAIVMLGRVPLGSSLTAFLGEGSFLQNFRLEVITGWLLNVPNAAGFRGIVIGVGLGIIATSVRIIFGVEKTYMGGGD